MLDDEHRRMKERLSLALDMWALGVELKRKQLERRGETTDTFERWLLERPGAELGDVSGDVAPRAGPR